ncbi:MAG: DNA replication/repair protein RecF [Proteobacteria bacterium]|nr:DNA replication/repair protein RecF [Pseudomonadota bacterium]
MWFNRLEVSNLRNIVHANVDLGPGLNYFHGPNGAGKTTLLEAVYLLARARSFRNSDTSTLIRSGTDALVVRGLFDHGGSIALSRSTQQKTELKINKTAERRLSRAAELVPLQLMLPELSNLVFGPPGERRRFLDWGVFHVKPAYLDDLRRYLRALSQRNSLLKRFGHGVSSDDLDPWSEQLIETGERIHTARNEYVQALMPIFYDVLRKLAPELNAELTYHGGWSGEQRFGKVLGEWTARDVKSGATQVGPHRADVTIQADRQAAQKVLSRGQGKMVASALLVGQAMLLARRNDKNSIFLIDDIGAELDLVRNRRFFEILGELDCQILASSTLEPSVFEALNVTQKPLTVFHVEHGAVHRE